MCPVLLWVRGDTGGNRTNGWDWGEVMRHLPQVQDLRGTQNSAFVVKDILMQYLKNKSECKEIHDEQNTKSSSQVQISQCSWVFLLPQVPGWLAVALSLILSWCKNVDILFIMDFVVYSFWYFKNNCFKILFFLATGNVVLPLTQSQPYRQTSSLRVLHYDGERHAWTRKPVRLTSDKCYWR